MAYEVSSSIAAGTNYFQAVTGSTGSRNAGGTFSPDGTKLPASIDSVLVQPLALEDVNISIP